MTRFTATLAVVVLVTTAVGMVPVTGVAQQETSDSAESAIAPGERLGGVVGVQGAEFAGEVERRTFGLEVAGATSDEARADVVATQLDEIEARLGELEEQKRRIDRAGTNGSISEGSYDARMTVVAARGATLRLQLDAVEAASADLPSELLRREGIDASAIRTLREEASALTGPEVAAVARRIAGPDVGASIATDRGRVTVGPAGNETPTVGVPSDPTVDADATATEDGDADDGPPTVDLG